MSGDTHCLLVKKAAEWLRKKHSVVITEMAGGSECPDAIGFTAGLSTLIECKASRADFWADAKKPFRLYPPGGMGVFRYYMAPADMIKSEEIPENWGLLELFEGGRVRAKRAAAPQKCDATRERAILVSALRRVAEVTPDGVSVRFYKDLTAETVTIGILPAGAAESGREEGA